MPRTALAVLVAFVILAGCTDGSTPPILAVGGSPAARGDRPRGVYLMIPRLTEAETRPLLFAAGHISYMNRQGGTYTPANVNNASTNASTIPLSTSSVPPWQIGDAGWAQVMDCVRDQFAPFDIQITDVD